MDEYEEKQTMTTQQQQKKKTCNLVHGYDSTLWIEQPRDRSWLHIDNHFLFLFKSVCKIFVYDMNRGLPVIFVVRMFWNHPIYSYIHTKFQHNLNPRYTIRTAKSNNNKVKNRRTRKKDFRREKFTIYFLTISLYPHRSRQRKRESVQRNVSTVARKPIQCTKKTRTR